MDTILESDWKWAANIVEGAVQKRSEKWAAFGPCVKPTLPGLILAAMLTARRDNDHDEFRRLGSLYPGAKAWLVAKSNEAIEETPTPAPPDIDFPPEACRTPKDATKVPEVSDVEPAAKAPETCGEREESAPQRVMTMPGLPHDGTGVEPAEERERREARQATRESQTIAAPEVGSVEDVLGAPPPDETDAHVSQTRAKVLRNSSIPGHMRASDGPVG